MATRRPVLRIRPLCEEYSGPRRATQRRKCGHLANLMVPIGRGRRYVCTVHSRGVVAIPLEEVSPWRAA